MRDPDMSQPCLHKSFWSFICGDESVSSTCASGSKMMLQTFRQVQENLPELFPIPPKVINYPMKNNILVYTSDSSEEGVKRSAEVLRSHIDFPFAIYFFKKPASGFDQRSALYMHVSGDEFYKYSSKNSAGSYWNLISKETELHRTIDNILPSQLTDREHIHLPVDKNDFEKATNGKGGKWILHCSDWETLDIFWKNLIRLYDTKVLVGVKSCTAGFSISKTNPNYQTKAVMCYTADSSCKSSVRRAAESIYICTGYDSIMYYKTNEASRNGKYKHEGFHIVCKYMFTSTRQLMERDDCKRWKLITNEDENHK